jgi:hypothetical protein
MSGKRYGAWATGLTLAAVLGSAVALAVLRHVGAISGHAERLLSATAAVVIAYSAFMWATRVKRRMWAQRVARSEARRRRARGGIRGGWV